MTFERHSDSPIEPGTAAESAAAQWLVRIDAGDMEQSDWPVFEAWLDEDAAHRQAMARFETLWEKLDSLSQLRDRADGSSAIDIHADGPQAEPVSTYRPRPIIRRPQFAFAAIAAVALALVMLVALPFGATEYRTDIGERLVVTLDDASVVELNTDSHIEVAFSSGERRIELLNGEVYFQVAHDAERPFIVETPAGHVRAVGTAFSIFVDGAEADVTVTEGEVEIIPERSDAADAGSRPPVVVAITAGQAAALRGGRAEELTLAPEAVERQLAWRDGMLDFDGETVEEVVEVIGRYTETEIVIADDAIRDLRVGGRLQAGDIDGALALLETAFPIRVERRGDEVLLSGYGGG
ncbi:DUF4880 domain-containing protein [Parasphingopyxis algicola]|uniref:FecR family protein n=1 Tax=Parasphingopyxis algicola TaxID=2026624 RepID=UPI0015A4C926|nr:FecR domain-containing protein [Parasphingopyxis algicola]QLC24891.1 DUF4880 domain-containing protein [Parasphingopyxis algicola]